jgi:organic hydroperoxide reductase OsmC/OhrA/uncharacterized damage-inducible protein DinB
MLMLYAVDPQSTTEDLLQAYEQSPQWIRQAIAGMDHANLTARPIAGMWSTLEVVCHLADTDIYFVDRIERTLAHQNPLLMGVDERPYAERLQFQLHEIEEELRLMEALRGRTAKILRRQNPEAWQRTAVHSERGKVTLRQMVEGSVGHVLHHLPFIEQKRAALGLSPASAVAPQKAWPEFKAHVSWTNQGPDFARGKYPRRHTWTFDGGLTLAASASPHVVPAPWSVEEAIDPEEALVAAAASCHMLTFLWLAAKAGFTVERYDDAAIGTMEKNASRQAYISQITLHPTIIWGPGGGPDAAQLAALHETAHQQCFIANSIRCKIVIAR